MRDPIRVLVLGTGQMGTGIARLVLQKPGLELVGVYGRRPERAGRDVGALLGLDRELGLFLSADLAQLTDAVRPELAIQATCSHLDDALGELEILLERGVSVISIAEEMARPATRSPELARHLDRLAKAHGSTVLGTGINPGFVLDLLVVALTGVCSRVDSIRATRVNDLSPYGPSVLRSQGVALTPAEFRRGVADGSVVGHVGFPESIGLIADALGWEIGQIEESREPIVSRVPRETPHVRVEPGQVAGCLHTARAFAGGRQVVTLIHPQQIQPQLEAVETGDEIVIEGIPPVRLAGRPEIPGGLGTMALAVNAIPRVLEAPPGLRSMVELPVPAAMPGAGLRGEVPSDA